VFGVDYFYRVTALDSKGNQSPYSTTDATTPTFSANTSGSGSVMYSSEDNIATVQVPAGAVNGSAECSVTTVDTKSVSQPPGMASQPLVVGPYSLLCKTAGGDEISGFNQPLSWAISLKGKLSGLSNPQAFLYGDFGSESPISNATYNSKTDTMSFSTTSTNSVLILATVVHGISINTVATFSLLLLIVVGVLLLVLRQRQKTKYNDYIRHKYYEL